MSQPTANAARPASARGFSLIELAVVLVLLGLTSALAAASLRGTKSVMENALLKQQLVDFDQRVRQRAQMGGEIREVTLDLDGRSLAEQRPDESFTTPLRWSDRPQHARVAAAWTPSTGWVRRGLVAWRCSPDGVTPTYALELADATDRGGEEGERWLVAGVSGQWSRLGGGGSGEAVLETLRGQSGG